MAARFCPASGRQRHEGQGREMAGKAPVVQEVNKVGVWEMFIGGSDE
jgi:hypothetical protein